MAEGLLNGFRALDLTDEKGFACGKILAALGVETIKVEKPGGDPARGVPPFLHNKPDPEKSLFWLAFNTNKRSITLDLTTGEGRGLFLKLVATSDFILESFTPGYMETLGLGYDALRQINPRIIMTSITPFGQKGPYSRYKGSELIISAMSGIMATNGDPDRPPLREGPDSIYFESCAAATAGTIIAHFHREHTGEGQQVDVSLQEVPAKRMATNIVPWEFDRRLTTRNGTSRSFGVHSTHWIWPCKDGYVFWQFLGGKFSAAGNRALSQWIDDDGQDNPLRKITDWEEFDMAAVTREELVVQQAAIARFFMNHTKKEIAEEGLRRRINATVVSTVADIMENIQLKARNCWVKLNDPDNTGILAYPRHFFVCSETENFVRIIETFFSHSRMMKCQCEKNIRRAQEKSRSVPSNKVRKSRPWQE